MIDGVSTRDRLGRPMADLRISVMDRCNFRCTYCMPEAMFGENYDFLSSGERLSFAEITRVCRTAATLGVRKLRLTGGEPLLRPDLDGLVRQLRDIPGIEDLALTTNGVLLPSQAASLRAAGLDRVTVSLDALDEAVFARITGNRGSAAAVLRGIDAARDAGLPVKLNCVVQAGINECEVLPLLQRFRFTGIAVRFIEFMDVGNRNRWSPERVVPSEVLASRIRALWPIVPLPARHAGEVATRFRFLDGGGELGFISSVSTPFCGDCARARLSSEGQLFTCLFATKGIDLRTLLRDPEMDDTALQQRLQSVWRDRGDRYSEERAARHADSRADRAAPKVEMYYIGG